MKILITAGGVQEPIDTVRSITNRATGSLGALTADKAAEEPFIKKIFFICPKSSVLPKTEKAVIYHTEDVLDVQNTLHNVLMKEQPDIIIHSMAVSDYRVKKITTLKDVVKLSMENKEYEAVKKSVLSRKEEQGKISSSVPDLMLLLEQTPKIIALLRSYAPRAVIVGFKLLDSVSEETLLAKARTLMKKNDCDFVLANDMQTVNAQHCGYLLNKADEVFYFEGKEAIAQGILNAVLKKWR